MLFSLGDGDRIKDRFATYFSARLLTHEWVKPGDEVHEIYLASSDVRDADGNEIITAYAVKRPDALWSILLINKDSKRSFNATVNFRPQSKLSTFRGAIEIFQYSGKEYELGGTADDPHPTRAKDPEHKVLKSTRSNPFQVSLPAYSLTIIRGLAPIS